MFSLESLRDSIFQGWLVWLLSFLISLVLSGLVYGILYSLGKDTAIKPERRKFFFGISTFLLFLLLIFLVHLNGQIEDIRRASPKPGGLHAGLIWLAAIPDEQVRSDSNPTFTISNSVPTVSMSGIGPGTFDKGVNMMMILRIDNSGPPSVAWGWKARLVLPGGSALPAIIPSVGEVNGVVSTIIGPIHMGMDNNLLSLLNESPLGTGTAKVGWLPIHVNGLREVPHGTRVELTFTDVFGRVIKVEHVWGPPFD